MMPTLAVLLTLPTSAMRAVKVTAPDIVIAQALKMSEEPVSEVPEPRTVNAPAVWSALPAKPTAPMSKSLQAVGSGARLVVAEAGSDGALSPSGLRAVTT